MRPINQKWIAKVQIWLGGIFTGGFALLSFYGTDKKDLSLIIIGAIGALVSSFIFNRGFENQSIFQDFVDAKDKMDSFSLIIFAKNHRGLLHTYSYKSIQEDTNLLLTIRHLLNLKLIKNFVFPESLHQAYVLTDIGRYVLEKELRFKSLYQDIFCDAYFITHLRGSAYKNEFVREQKIFRRKYLIRWIRCHEIFREMFQRKGMNIMPEDNIESLFRTYSHDISFEAIKKEIIDPWEQVVNNEKKWWNYVFRFVPLWSSRT